MEKKPKLPTRDELTDEIFSFIQPAKNAATPCNSDGYNESEVCAVIREVLLRYKYGIIENK